MSDQIKSYRCLLFCLLLLSQLSLVAHAYEHDIAADTDDCVFCFNQANSEHALVDSHPDPAVKPRGSERIGHATYTVFTTEAALPNNRSPPLS